MPSNRLIDSIDVNRERRRLLTRIQTLAIVMIGMTLLSSAVFVLEFLGYLTQQAYGVALAAQAIVITLILYYGLRLYYLDP